MGADNPGKRWRLALLDFSYHNICFNLKQLIEVLHCDLQVTIHQGLVEAQVDILEVIASFVNHFHIKVTTLSAPQVHVLLDHMCARCACSHSSLVAIRQGTTSARLESFLERGPTHLLQSFFDRLPDHQAGIDRGSTHPTQLKSEVDRISQALQTGMIDTASNPALMLNFKSEIAGVPTIDLAGEKADIHYPPLREGTLLRTLKTTLMHLQWHLAIPSIDMVFVMNHS